MLVTRNGIATKAKLAFDGRTTVHYTIEELQNLLVDPSTLVDEMERQMEYDDLNLFYIHPEVYDVDIKRAAETYNLWYNEFVAFALTRHLTDFETAKNAWSSRADRSHSVSLSAYTEKSFGEALAIRQRSYNRRDLEELILKWLADDKIDFGVALLGTYGTGKSSFARRIAHVVARLFKQGKSARIPLMIELKDFGSHQSIEGLITHTLVNKYGYQNGSYTIFRHMNERGRYFLIMDGFDEMKQGMTRDALMFNFREINGLLRGKAKVMLCGRPTVFESEEEQASILSGGEALESGVTARYIPLEIAPFTIETTISLIVSFVKARAPEDKPSIERKIQGIRTALNNNSELADLLSRPVHVPMFVTILPEYEGDIRSLNRGFLYETFINKTISREVQRLPPAYQNRYTADQRLQFAGSLAIEIDKKGDTRSIRRSEIPAAVL
jgi:hypothetical protein